MSKQYTPDDVFNDLVKLVAKAGSQKDAANALNIRPQYLCDILLRRRALSPVVARALGYEPQTVYLKVGE